MKKSLLFTILAAAFAVLLFVGGSHETVQAEGEHTHCVCGTGTLTAGDHTMHDNTQVWQEWTSTTTLPTYGDCTVEGYNYFYLKNNVTFNSTTKSWYVGTDGSNPRVADMGNKKIVICFNGKTITTTASGYRIMTAYAGQSNGADYWTANIDITFTDCQGTGEMKPIADATYSYGTRGVLFWLSGTKTKLTIYGGTFSGNGSSLRGSGHLIYAVSDSVLNLYGGTITGGKGVSFTETNGTIRYPQGGCIYSEGTVNIYGGTVSNGMVNNSLTDKPGQKGGGNIYCSGTLNISGGTITGGEVKSSSQSDHLGGNIYANLINMTGGTVSNGVVRETSAGGNGGNVYCYGTFRLSGGTITGGYAKTNGGNIRINKTFIMTGGTIENSANGENLFINIVATGEMSGGVIRNAASNSFNVAMNGYAKYKNGIFTLKDGTIIRDTEHPGRNIYVNGSFYMQGGTVSGGSRLGNDTADTGRNYVGGNIYVNAAASRELPSGVTDETDYRPLLKITGGTISGGQAERGGNIFIGNGKHTIKNAVITGGIAKNDSASAAAHPRGGNIYMEYGTLSIEDSTISEGQALDTASKKYACGGNIFANSGATSVSLSGSTVVEDGVVNGGTAWAAGGNLALYCNATIGSGVQVLNGSSTQDGGNVYLTTSGRTFTIDGVTVTGGTASTGGNFSLDSGVKVTVTNSTVSGGTATAKGGNFLVKGTNYGAELTLGSGTNITGGTAPTGGSIYMQISVSSTVPSDARGPKVTVNGAVIDGGRATSGSGGNIYVGGNASAPGKLIIESGTITNGRATNKGGNIVVFYTNSTVTMSGGTISNGTAEGTGVGNSGGNVHMGDTNVSFTMTGGTVTGGKVISHGSTSSAWGIGGNFHVDSKTTLNVSGGTISDGYVKNADRNSGNGYNISVNGTLNVSGTAFIGGKGQVSDSDKTLGNNVATQAATGKIYISGGTVGTGEESTQVVVKDSLIEMTGGTAAALSCYKGLITVSGGRVSGYLGCSGSVAADTSIQVTGGYIQSVYYPTPANCTAELSGGFYAVEPPTSLVKEGLMKIPGTYSNPDTTDTTVYKFEIAEGVVIEATSRVKLGDMPVAAVTGGGPVKKNGS